MEVSGTRNLQAAVMRRNGGDALGLMPTAGEAYELLGELVGECSACDLHLALSLVSKLRDFGIHAPMHSLGLHPGAVLEKRQRQRQRRLSQFAESMWQPTSSIAGTGAWGHVGQAGTPSAAWNHLPQDLLLRVLRSLSCDDWLVVGSTCAAWRRVVGVHVHDASFSWAGRQELDRAGTAPLVDAVVRGACVIYRDLRSVSFRRCELLSSEALSCLARASCKNLKALDLSGCAAVRDVGVIAVAEACQALEDVQVASCSGLTDCAFVAIGSFCTRLRRLNACGCEQLTDLGVKCLSQGARGLKDVNLGWCELVTGEGVEALARNCPQLESVDLCGCLQVGDQGIAALASGCRGLQSLGLHCCRRLTDASQLSIAAHLHGLQRLNISGCRALTPAAVQIVLDKNPNLHTCGGLRRNVIVAGCLDLLAATCRCPPSVRAW